MVLGKWFSVLIKRLSCACLHFSLFPFSISLAPLTDQTVLSPCYWAASCKQELYTDPSGSHLIQAHASLLPPSLLYFSFFVLLLFCDFCQRAKILTPKIRGREILWEHHPVWKMDCWVCPMLIVSLTHRLFMWLYGGWPLPSSASHPHPRGSHSAWVRLGGKLELLCSGGFLGEAVKAATVWAFISPEKRRREKRHRERARGRWGEYQKRVWTQTALLTGTPREEEDERERERNREKSK